MLTLAKTACYKGSRTGGAPRRASEVTARGLGCSAVATAAGRNVLEQLVDRSTKLNAVKDVDIGKQHGRRAEQIGEALVGEEEGVLLLKCE